MATNEKNQIGKKLMAKKSLFCTVTNRTHITGNYYTINFYFVNLIQKTSKTPKKKQKEQIEVEIFM